jgi:hypothetical protein
MALASTVCGGGGDAAGQWLLTVTGESAELASCADGSSGAGAPLLRHLPVTVPPHATNGAGAAVWGAVGGEVRRAVALLPRGGGGAGAQAAAPRSMLVWDAVGLGESPAAADLGRKLGLEVDLFPHTQALPAGNDDETARRRFGPAIALAASAALDRPLALDLLHSRLAEPKRSWLDSKRARVGILVGLLALAGIWLFIDMRQRQGELARLAALARTREPQVRAAEVLSEKVKLADAWYARRPGHLACLREITAAFPDEGTIWAGNVSLYAGGAGTVSGRAVDQRTVLAVADRMRACWRLADVKVVETREAGGNTREVLYTIGFRYLGEQP